MKRLILIFMILGVFLTTDAQTPVRDAWLSMPDNIIGYLNKNLRQEHLDYINMKVKSEVKNQFLGQGVMDSLSTHYLSIHLNDVTDLQLAVFETQDSVAPVYCMIKTVKMPYADSDISFYNADWSRIPHHFGLPFTSERDSLFNTFTVRPDTMNVERYEELKAMMDPIGLKISCLKDGNTLLFEISAPYMNKDEEQQIRAIIKQRKYKWDGKIFNES
ncbi:MAG: DUF3256 family protein [Prevotella sp.]|nr:DUF3256 family protein [Prevotella sp.]